MSNELTPQEQYPKFYKDPHLWIGAIEVEYSILGGVSQKMPLTVGIMNSPKWNLKKFTPLFKPQEGDQIIKDLESAVSAGLFGESILLAVLDKPESPSIYFEFGDEVIEIRKKDLSIQLPHGICFNTAAYVTTLLKLGYYL
jgi:hypothetical protein